MKNNLFKKYNFYKNKSLIYLSVFTFIFLILGLSLIGGVNFLYSTYDSSVNKINGFGMIHKYGIHTCLKGIFMTHSTLIEQFGFKSKMIHLLQLGIVFSIIFTPACFALSIIKTIHIIIKTNRKIAININLNDNLII